MSEIESKKLGEEKPHCAVYRYCRQKYYEYTESCRTAKQSVCNYRRRKYEQYGRWEYVQRAIAAFTLLFVMAYTVITTLIWITSRDTERRQLQAYVGLHRGDNWVINIRCKDCDGLPSTPLPKTLIERRDRDQLDFTLKNFGLTPAFRPRSCGMIEATALGSAGISVPRIREIFSDCEKRTDISLSTIWPGEERPYVALFTDKMADAIWKARIGQANAFVVGFIEYEDAFGKSHRTYICYEYLPPSGEQPEAVAACPNVIDHDY